MRQTDQADAVARNAYIAAEENVMGLRGPKPARADGCHLTPKGYLRVYFDGRLRMQHDVVWEQHNGPIPSGFDVHHKNEIKTDNRIENLELVDKLTHKRLHSGCELRDGVWWKPCGRCSEFKPVDVEHWYLSKEGWPNYGRCRVCHIRIVVAYKQRRRSV